MDKQDKWEVDVLVRQSRHVPGESAHVKPYETTMFFVGCCIDHVLANVRENFATDTDYPCLVEITGLKKITAGEPDQKGAG